MIFFIGVLTFLMVVNCFLLILLVLVQLPKKDAGAGMAFGAGTADALFGSGSGNMLTKITKYSTGVFLGMAIFLRILQGYAHNQGNVSSFTKMVEQKQQQSAGAQLTQQPKATGPVAATNNTFSLTQSTATNAPTATATNLEK